jgi:hypothetical protein
MRLAQPSDRRVATWRSIANSAPRPSPTTAFPSRRRSNSKTRSRTWARNFSKKPRQKTNDIAGDGTTTSTVLAHAIVNEGLKALEAGYNPMLLKHGISLATETIVEELRKMSVKIDTKGDIASVATNSAADEEIGGLIADVMDKVGKDGVITVEESKIHAVRNRIRRRYAVRPRLPLPLLHHQRGQDGSHHPTPTC